MAKAKTATTKRIRVGMVEFIQAVEKAESLKDVAMTTGLKEMSVYARYLKYSKTLPLKQFPRNGGTRLNAQKAIELLASLRNVTAEAVVSEQVARNVAKTAK